MKQRQEIKIVERRFKITNQDLPQINVYQYKKQQQEIKYYTDDYEIEIEKNILENKKIVYEEAFKTINQKRIKEHYETNKQATKNKKIKAIYEEKIKKINREKE